jgi:hypothetical protein
VPREIQGMSLPLGDEAEKVSRRGRIFFVTVSLAVAVVVFSLWAYAMVAGS